MRKLTAFIASVILLFGTSASADTLTVYPDAYPGATTYNGYYSASTVSSWSGARASSGSTFATTEANWAWFQAEKYPPAGEFYINRCSALFDTSALGAGATVSAATFSIKGNSNGNTTETTYPANGSLVGVTPASNTVGTSGDITQFGTTRYADTDVTISALAGTSDYVDWVLNATGLAAISTTGVTKLGIRASNDYSDSTAPTDRSYATALSSNTAGTTSDPKLVITYTPGAATSDDLSDFIFFE